jgi:hypothetical protein
VDIVFSSGDLAWTQTVPCTLSKMRRLSTREYLSR